MSVGEGGRFRDWLDGTNFVVGGHEANKSRLTIEGVRERCQISKAFGVNR